MTKKDNKNIAYKLGAEIIDYMTYDESHELYDKGWRVLFASYDKNGNENSIIISNGKNFKYINKPYNCDF
jgi:hypothetical protein